MPRHIRSVTARRPRRIARPVKDVPATSAPAADSAPAVLAPPAAALVPAPSAPAASAPASGLLASATPVPAAGLLASAAPVPAASAPAVPAPASRAQQAELFESLRRAFQATPDIPETPERTRERYVWAIESVAEYLESIGADAAWVERIDELGWALEDLTNGLVPPLLQPTQAKRRTDPGPWSPG